MRSKGKSRQRLSASALATKLQTLGWDLERGWLTVAEAKFPVRQEIHVTWKHKVEADRVILELRLELPLAPCVTSAAAAHDVFAGAVEVQGAAPERTQAPAAVPVLGSRSVPAGASERAGEPTRASAATAAENVGEQATPATSRALAAGGPGPAGKGIKKTLAALWKDIRKQVMAGERPTEAEYAHLIALLEAFAAQADPLWAERWREFREVTAGGLDPEAPHDLGAIRATLETANRMIRECHKRFR